MPPLRRHQLAHLTPAGWREVLARAWDTPSRACLQHWAANALPLVVTRQRTPGHERDRLDACGAVEPQAAGVALGLAAPARWGRRALALQAAPDRIGWFSEFPLLAQTLAVLPRDTRQPLQTLDERLRRLGVRARAYGSAGWQQLTALNYLHDRSDLDLWLAVDDIDSADDAAHALQQCGAGIRLDGELVFGDGSAVAWREWAAWRAGSNRHVLVKRLDGARLEADPAALAAGRVCAA